MTATRAAAPLGAAACAPQLRSCFTFLTAAFTSPPTPLPWASAVLAMEKAAKTGQREEALAEAARVVPLTRELGQILGALVV